MLRFARALTFSLLLAQIAMLATFSFTQTSSGRTGTGIFRGRRVTYQVVQGRTMYEGDIALDHVAQRLPEAGNHPGGTLDYLQYLWPKVGTVYQIPYTIDAASGDVDNINAAVAQYNSIFAG